MIEIEVKLRIGKTADIESRLRALGAYLETKRTLEDDAVYDFPDRRLTDAGRLLRLRRRPDGAVLTFKDTADPDRRAKVRREVETRVVDGAALVGILLALGLESIWRYQKQRTTYRLGRLHALVDELPIGNFLELEGAEVDIDRWAGALGFSRADYLVATYRDLHESWLEEHGLPDGDMVFPEEAR